MSALHARATPALLTARQHITDLQAENAALRHTLARTRHQLALHTAPTDQPAIPQRLADIEVRAQQAPPNTPLLCAPEVLTLIHHLRQAHANATALALPIHRVHELATEWSTSPDLTQAAAGRIVLAALHGPHTPTGLI